MARYVFDTSALLKRYHVDGQNLDVMGRFIAAEPFCAMRFYSQPELKAIYPDAPYWSSRDSGV